MRLWARISVSLDAGVGQGLALAKFDDGTQNRVQWIRVAREDFYFDIIKIRATTD
jgi:hypothetical protein